MIVKPVMSSRLSCPFSRSWAPLKLGAVAYMPQNLRTGCTTTSGPIRRRDSDSITTKKIYTRVPLYDQRIPRKLGFRSSSRLLGFGCLSYEGYIEGVSYEEGTLAYVWEDGQFYEAGFVDEVQCDAY